jgi:L-threonylcarbamoyladenylate synthase
MEMIHTEHWFVDKSVYNLRKDRNILAAAEKILQNEVIAFPTETVYGLGGNALSGEAISKIFTAKGRPGDNPLIVHIFSVDQLEGITANVPEAAKKLMTAFWPGPLTLVLPKGVEVADQVTANLSTVAVRMPDHPVALALLEAAGVPVAAPSANLSGKPSPTSARHVDIDLNGRIAGIVDGGETGVGVESTVVDCSGDVVTILRPGGIVKEQLENVVGTVVVDPALLISGEAPKSPGMKYQHYAPTAALFLVDGSFSFLQKIVDRRRAEGQRVGILSTEERTVDYSADVVLSCGTRKDLFTVARGLYGALRLFDEQQVDEIYSEVFPRDGVGEAVMNRLHKAAGGRVMKE